MTRHRVVACRGGTSAGCRGGARPRARPIGEKAVAKGQEASQDLRRNLRTGRLGLGAHVAPMVGPSCMHCIVSDLHRNLAQKPWAGRAHGAHGEPQRHALHHVEHHQDGHTAKLVPQALRDDIHESEMQRCGSPAEPDLAAGCRASL